MSYLYLNDCASEEDRYDGDYIYFNGSNAEAVAKIQDILTHNNPKDPNIRAILNSICQESFKTNNINLKPDNTWLGKFSRFVHQLF